VESKRPAIVDTTHDLQQQQKQVAEAILELRNAVDKLQEVAEVNEQVANAGIDENEYTALSFEEVSATYGELCATAEHKLQFLDHQLALLDMQKLPQEQLDGMRRPRCRTGAASGLTHDHGEHKALCVLVRAAAEYKRTFKHFDKDNSGALGQDEFTQTLQALGENLTVCG